MVCEGTRCCLSLMAMPWVYPACRGLAGENFKLLLGPPKVPSKVTESRRPDNGSTETESTLPLLVVPQADLIGMGLVGKGSKLAAHGPPSGPHWEAGCSSGLKILLRVAGPAQSQTMEASEPRATHHCWLCTGWT